MAESNSCTTLRFFERFSRSLPIKPRATWRSGETHPRSPIPRQPPTCPPCRPLALWRMKKSSDLSAPAEGEDEYQDNKAGFHHQQYTHPVHLFFGNNLASLQENILGPQKTEKKPGRNSSRVVVCRYFDGAARTSQKSSIKPQLGLLFLLMRFRNYEIFAFIYFCLESYCFSAFFLSRLRMLMPDIDLF